MICPFGNLSGHRHRRYQMSLKGKLAKMHELAEQDGYKTFQRSTRELADLIATVLRDRNWDSMSVKTDDKLSNTVSEVREAARLLDAAEYIQEKVLSPSNGKIVDLRLKKNKDFQVVQEQIKEMFATKKVPQRGFVYVAWSRKPERYLYVGKAKSPSRLDLTSNGKLSWATMYATTLSLLFPSKSDEEILLGVEASILSLINNYTRKLPKHNVSNGKVPLCSVTAEIENLAIFLNQIADFVYPPPKP